ncbi:putative membrane protein [Thermacetogenium phaeum DSM 12270]|uniref:Putative membrane protein n=1 Tax=Thermacetogenium phaeum (strain ATCC BAA-254 / DSM 26808 / PB) TaxID=1089553 RepID=K4LEL5_THEPS|nr:putative membrane protein [Thermacetogenium phaeum DSM 12270]
MSKYSSGHGGRLGEAVRILKADPHAAGGGTTEDENTRRVCRRATYGRPGNRTGEARMTGRDASTDTLRVSMEWICCEAKRCDWQKQFVTCYAASQSCPEASRRPVRPGIGSRAVDRQGMRSILKAGERNHGKRPAVQNRAGLGVRPLIQTLYLLLPGLALIGVTLFPVGIPDERFGGQEAPL